MPTETLVQKSGIATSTKLILAFVAAGIVAGLFFSQSALFTGTKTTYAPPPEPVASILRTLSKVSLASHRERKPYDQSTLLIQFASDVTNPKETVDDIVKAVPSAGIVVDSLERNTATLEPTKSQSVDPLFPRVETAGGKMREQFPERYRRGGSTTTPSLLQWYKVTFDGQPDIELLHDVLGHSDQVVNVSFNSIMEIQSDPTSQDSSDSLRDTPDPYVSSSGTWGQLYPDLWGHWEGALNAVGAWSTTEGSSATVVAVSDTGVDYSHEDIAENIWSNPEEIPENGVDDDNNGYVDDVRGYDFTTCTRWDGTLNECAETKPQDNDPMDDNGHGTHVAGTIAAVKDNGVGIAGVCPRCTVMPIKGLTGEGWGWSDELAQTIYYAALEGADVINLSWGGSGTNEPVEEAIQFAYDAGVEFAVAAGNESANAEYYSPARMQIVTTVSATDVNNSFANFSNYGSVIDVAAPGVDILSLRASSTDIYGDGSNFVPAGDPNARYMRLSGTSMATPHIAGLYGLLLSQGKTREEARSALKNYAEDVNNGTLPGWDIYFGNGRANANRSAAQLTSLQARIDVPSDALQFYEKDAVVTVSGTAAGPDFNGYTIEYAKNFVLPTEWHAVVQSESQVNSGTLANWDTSGILPGEFLIKLTVSDSLGNTISEVNQTQIGMLHGWPKDVTAVDTVPTAVDFDPTVPGNEIVYLEGNTVKGFHGDGTLIPSFTLSARPSQSYPLTFADLDADNELEVIALDSSNGVVARNRDGSTVPGFPAALPTPPLGWTIGMTWATSVISAADVNADGRPELLLPVSVDAPGVETAAFGRILIYSHTGDRLIQPSDPEGLAYPTDLRSIANHPPSVGDLDGDGDLEILTSDSIGFVYAFHHDGSVVAGWPTYDEQSSPGGNFEEIGPARQFRSPATADLDGDGKDEVITASRYSWRVYVRNGDGSLYGQSPYGTYGEPSDIAVADADNDGVQEIVVRTFWYVQAFHRNGIPVEGFPSGSLFPSFSGVYPPMIGDFSSATGKEVLWSDSWTKFIQGTTSAGASMTDGLPLFFMYTPVHSPILADVTGDGITDIAVVEHKTSSPRKYIFSLFTTEFPAGDASAWSYPFHDTGLSSRASCPECTPAAEQPYDAQTISCDAVKETPSVCERNFTSHASCGSTYCASDCMCSPYTDQVRGWPAKSDIFLPHDPVITADLNGDGETEVIQGRRVFNADGTANVSFARAASPSYPYAWKTGAAVGDTDGDGGVELASTAQWYESGPLYAFTLFDGNGDLMTGWPVRSGNGQDHPSLSVAIGDVSRSVPGKEIVGVESFTTNRLDDGVLREYAVIHVLNSAGQELPGFPVRFHGQITEPIGVAIGDVDGDQSGEVVATFAQTLANTGEDGARVVVVDENGLTLWTHRNTIAHQYLWYGLPTIGDLDPARSGKEIVIAEEYGDGDDGYSVLHTLDRNRNELPGWPKSYHVVGLTYQPPVVYDADGDGMLEIAAGFYPGDYAGRTYVYEHTGAVKNGWPVTPDYFGENSGLSLSFSTCPYTAADLDADGKSELVICTSYGLAAALNEDASLVGRWPIFISHSTEFEASPRFDDINRDGIVDFLALSHPDSLIRAFDLGVSFRPSSGDYRIYRGDIGSSGASPFVPRLPGGKKTLPVQPPGGG